jgi:hypothetical protein
MHFGQNSNFSNSTFGNLFLEYGTVFHYFEKINFLFAKIYRSALFTPTLHTEASYVMNIEGDYTGFARWRIRIP